jgi:hypothetical protein
LVVVYLDVQPLCRVMHSAIHSLAPLVVRPNDGGQKIRGGCKKLCCAVPIMLVVL